MPGMYVLRDDSYDYDDQEGERAETQSVVATVAWLSTVYVS